ncbi:MAG: DNA sulfur modification protein DndB [Halothece sp.]
MVANLSNSLTIPVPCIRGIFGNQLFSYQTQIRPTELRELLGHDPRSQNWKNLPAEIREIYQYLQRPTNKKRREGTARYIRDRFDPDNSFSLGAFPAISIGVTTPLTFTPYTPYGEDINSAVGKLHFDLSANSTRILLDGLARYTGAMEVYEEGNTNIVNSFAFPVTIYVPQNKTLMPLELGQLFHDFNFLASPIKKNQAIALDQSNIYVGLTKNLAKSDIIKRHGGVEERAASLGKKSTALVAQQVFLRFVRGACEGIAFQKKLSEEYPSGEPNLTRETFSSIKAKLENFLEVFAEAMGNSFRDHRLIHLTAPGWYAISLIFYDLEFRSDLSDVEKTYIYKRLGQINWTRYNPDFFGMLGEKDYDEKGKPYLSKARGGGTTPKILANYLRKQLGLDEFIQN